MNKNETTWAKQLAFCVTTYSPIQIAADLPEVCAKKMQAFQFINDVAIDWDNSKYLEAEPGEYITVAGKAKRTNNRFVGPITIENHRNRELSIDFPDNNKKYQAIRYADAADADYAKDPAACIISKQIVDSRSTLTPEPAAGGGSAISMMPVK